MSLETPNPHPDPSAELALSIERLARANRIFTDASTAFLADEWIDKYKKLAGSLAEVASLLESQRDEALGKLNILEADMPLVRGRTVNEANKLLGPILRHVDDEDRGASHGCVEAQNAQQLITTLIAEKEHAEAQRDEARRKVLADEEIAVLRRCEELLTKHKRHGTALRVETIINRITAK